MKLFILLAITSGLCLSSATAKPICSADIEYTFSNFDSHVERIEIDAKSKKDCLALAKQYELNAYPESVTKKKVIAKWEAR